MDLHWIDNSNGYRTGQGCPNARLLPFVEGSAPDRSTGCRQQGGGVVDWFQKLFRGS
jgi:penicillin-binding protein 1B